MSIFRFDRQIKDDKKRNASPTFGSRVANIRQIKENIVCEHCHKPGHKEGYCFRKAICDYCQKQGHTDGRCFKRRQDNSNKSGQTSPNNSKSQTKTGYKSPKKCSYCRNLGHIIFDCRKLMYQLEKRNQENRVRTTTDDARRSPTPNIVHKVRIRKRARRSQTHNTKQYLDGFMCHCGFSTIKRSSDTYDRHRRGH
ncbi:PREDICTED: uncharacterized protein LOC106792714 [Polistes canadensis]|uniref:uncharacterized protein LOC106792714 n=1 Tax=Polistes canadensis TaxID=91411 RepID=UPI000718FDD3|nr:PREDICTED: uncharacterized protein LOC106792714 [Polistes canadensis]